MLNPGTLQILKKEKFISLSLLHNDRKEKNKESLLHKHLRNKLFN